MHKAIRYGTIIGSLLLGAGCESQSGAPPESNFVPRPKYIPMAQAAESLGTRVHGYAFDPEAFFFSIATCGGPACPIPPFQLDNSPLYLRSIVRGAEITLLDPTTAPPSPAVPPVTANAVGDWTVEKVTSREGAPFFPFSTGAGALPSENLLPPVPPFASMPPIPTGNYLPTLTLRPVHTHEVRCLAIEANQVSDKGILEAVAKHLTAQGTSTLVSDFLNPARFGGVTIFWLYHPGFPFMRVPADGTTIEADAGQVLNVNWAPPGVLPPELQQSTRGFYVAEGAALSDFGIAVVLLPPSPPPVVTYRVVDPRDTRGTDQGNPHPLYRPWNFMPIQAPPAPGVIAFGGVQLNYSTGPSTNIYIPTACIPRG